MSFNQFEALKDEGMKKKMKVWKKDEGMKQNEIKVYGSFHHR